MRLSISVPTTPHAGYVGVQWGFDHLQQYQLPRPGGLVEIKSPLPLQYQPRDLTTRVHVLYFSGYYCCKFVYIEEVKFPTLCTSGLLAESKPHYAPQGGQWGLTISHIDRCTPFCISVCISSYTLLDSQFYSSSYYLLWVAVVLTAFWVHMLSWYSVDIQCQTLLRLLC